MEETLPDGMRRRWLRIEVARAVALAGVLGAAALVFVASAPTAAASTPATWRADLYDARAALWQEPDGSACTSAVALMMLNVVAYESGAQYMAPPDPRAPRTAPRWHADTSYATMETVLEFERSNMTMLARSAGSDPHGWRNALNYYGWGSVNAGVYRDSAYDSFDAAARAVVEAVARSGRPVGILARAGGHAQMVTGYVVTGDDPRFGDDFTIQGVFLTDPLKGVAMRDAWVSLDEWRWGPVAVRFSAYLQDDSPYRDGVDGNVGTAEWYGKWVILDAVR
jgi:hypothetical protein